MNGKSMHWVSGLAVLGIAVGLTAGFAVAGAAQSVSGKAYSTYVNTPLGSSGYSPLAVLPPVSGTAGAEAGAAGSVLNEQIPSGDGVTSSGLTVNMIHVYLQSLTGATCVLGVCTPGALTNTGEIIVGSATSGVAR